VALAPATHTDTHRSHVSTDLQQLTQYQWTQHNFAEKLTAVNKSVMKLLVAKKQFKTDSFQHFYQNWAMHCKQSTANKPVWFVNVCWHELQLSRFFSKYAQKMPDLPLFVTYLLQQSGTLAQSRFMTMRIGHCSFVISFSFKNPTITTVNR